MADPLDDPFAHEGIALYLHWPFCRSKCPYCDFNSHVAGKVDHDRWAGALARELEHATRDLEGRPLVSIFFGGGTPSLMAPATVERLVDLARQLFATGNDLEVTLEANPTSVERARFADFAKAGVNRVSLGVQALDDQALKALGREHDAKEALRAVEVARGLFPRFSFDLIYARPQQTLRAWEAELEEAISYASGHLSVYQLTIEPGTRFHQLHQAGRLVLPDDDIQAEMFLFTRERLEAAGLPAYEISNHARPEDVCRHNLVYWQGGDYLGVGPGAHGRLTKNGVRLATRRQSMPRAWLEAVERDGHAGLDPEILSPADQTIELLLMGLRLADGLDMARLERLCGRPLEQTLDGAALCRFIDEGLLHIERGKLRATPKGTLCLNSLLSALLDPLLDPVCPGG